MITFYYHPSPNPTKVALFLEESGLPFELVLVDIHKGEQHAPSFLAINPNGKTPALVDGDVTVFDSNAILLHLGVTTGKFIPPDTPALRAQMYSWLMFVASGLAPYSGQLAHFKYVAPASQDYALQRYDFEAWRHWNIVEAQLAKGRYMLGEQYTIVDMAVWAWAIRIPFLLGGEAWEKLPNVKRLVDEINERPAARRVEAIGSSQNHKTEFDADALAALFPHTARSASGD